MPFKSPPFHRWKREREREREGEKEKEKEGVI